MNMLCDSWTYVHGTASAIQDLNTTGQYIVFREEYVQCGVWLSIIIIVQTYWLDLVHSWTKWDMSVRLCRNKAC